MYGVKSGRGTCLRHFARKAGSTSLHPCLSPLANLCSTACANPSSTTNKVLHPMLHSIIRPRDQYSLRALILHSTEEWNPVQTTPTNSVPAYHLKDHLALCTFIILQAALACPTVLDCLTASVTSLRAPLMSTLTSPQRSPSLRLYWEDIPPAQCPC